MPPDSDQATLWEAPRPAPRILRVSDLNRRVRVLLDGDPVAGRCVGRGRGEPALLPAVGPLLLRPQGRRQPGEGGPLPRGAGARHRPPGARHAGDLPRQGARLRAAGQLPGLRRVDHAGRRRRPAPAVRGAAHQAGGGGALRGSVASGRCRAGRGGSGSSPRRSARCGATSATCMRRRYPIGELVLSPTIVQGPTASGAIVRALHRLYADAGDRPRSSWPAAAARSRTCGRSTTSGSCARWSRRRCRSWSGSATSRT